MNYAEDKLEIPDICPIRPLLSRLGDKWSLLVITRLADVENNRLRFSGLQRAIDGISQRMLTNTLRNLERDGLVSREIFAEVPPRVEYELTDLGISFLVPARGLVEWVLANWPMIEEQRLEYEERHK